MVTLNPIRGPQSTAVCDEFPPHLLDDSSEMDLERGLDKKKSRARRPGSGTIIEISVQCKGLDRMRPFSRLGNQA